MGSDRLGSYIKENRIRFILTGLHIILSFIFGRSVFINIGQNPSGTYAVNPVISDKAEIALTLSLTIFFAVLLIFLFWKLVFYLIKNFQKSFILFIALFLIGAAVLFIAWPEAFAGPDVLSDNLVTYACAVRLTPDYWHSAYTSILYGAALLMLPTNFPIVLLQWGGFVFALGYVFHRAAAFSKRLKYLVFAVFLFPNVYEILSYGHRMNLYTILLSIFAAKVVFDILEKKTVRGAEYALMAVLAAFLAVWRTEGIIVGSILYLIYLIFTRYAGKNTSKNALNVEQKLISVVIGLTAFAIAFVIISVPQKLGDSKYYGKDYSIINTFETLKVILNDSSADIAYEGADGDFKAVGVIVPVDLVKEKGTDGYRIYNYSVKGNIDINQSGADREEANAYMAAYKRIEKHNLPIVIKSKINRIFAAAGLSAPFTFEQYSGEPSDIPGWTYVGWSNGESDYYSDKLLFIWKDVPLRKRIADKLLRMRVSLVETAKYTKIYAALLVLLTGFSVFVFLRGVVAFFSNIGERGKFKTLPQDGGENKQTANESFIRLGACSFAALLGFAAILYAMPVEATIYYFSSSALLIIFGFAFILAARKNI